MKVRDLVQALSKLDWDREVEIGMLQKNSNAYYFRNGCAIYEEYTTGNYIILPNNSDCVES